MTPSAQTPRELVDRYWDELLRLDPLLATAIGDERFDDWLPDPSSEGRDERLRVHREMLLALEGLTDEDRGPELTTLELARTIAEDGIVEAELGVDRVHLVDHLLGPVNLVGELATLTVADRPERIESYVRRLTALGPYVDTISHEIGVAQQDGITWPNTVVERVLGQVWRLLATRAADTPLLSPVVGADAAVRDHVLSVITNVVLPAFARYGEVVTTGAQLARRVPGLVALRDGAAIYEACVRRWTTANADPAELIQIGRYEIEHIGRERETIVKRLGFAGVEEALGAYHGVERERLGDRQGVLRLVEGHVDKGWERAKDFFARLPPSNCTVRLVEQFREPDYPGATYQAPSPARDGIYLVNAAFYLDPKSQMLHRIATTSFHEANPGHHFQAALELMRPDAPALRRFAGFLRGDAFSEGWGLYAEALANEMGLFENDYERLGQLDNAALRAARLIVDTGIHALGWTRERGIHELTAAGLQRPEAENEVDRYAVDPGQALCYKVGELAIRRLRERYADAPGGLGAFHDRLLSIGALPLTLVEREMGRLYVEPQNGLGSSEAGATVAMSADRAGGAGTDR